MTAISVNASQIEANIVTGLVPFVDSEIETLYDTLDHSTLSGFVDNAIAENVLACPSDWPNDTEITKTTLSGLTGATTYSSLRPSGATGKPSSGSHSVGDFATATNGEEFVCSASGSPGTFARVSSWVYEYVTGTGETTLNVSIPSHLNYLEVRVNARSTRAANEDLIYVTFNSHTTVGSYAWQNLVQTDSGRGVGNVYGTPANSAYFEIGWIPAANMTTTTIWGSSILTVLGLQNPASANTIPFIWDSGTGWGTGAHLHTGQGVYRQSGTLSTIQFKLQNSDAFLANSTLTFFGA